jgi:predicted deacylase
MDTLTICDQRVAPGETRHLEIPVASLYTGSRISMPLVVLRGKEPGPTLFVSAAIHGDELNGIEIIRRLISRNTLKILQGTLIAVPIVNVHGVISQSRYMPDRRDLNRSFPGSPKGALAGRVADLFLNEVVRHCDYGIDLHTGAIHRSNLPQIRADLSDPETLTLAQVFGAPVALNANVRDGSLRQTAAEQGKKILLYEGGEALRFDEFSIRAGLKGVLNVMEALRMIRARRTQSKSDNKVIQDPFIAHHSLWVRAPSSGIVRDLKKLGDYVETGQPLAHIGSPLGQLTDTLNAPQTGIIIGKQNIPLVQEGDAMYHIACFDEPRAIPEHIETMQDDLLPSDTSD